MVRTRPRIGILDALEDHELRSEVPPGMNTFRSRRNLKNSSGAVSFSW